MSFPSHAPPGFELKPSPQNIPLLATGAGGEGILGQMMPLAYASAKGQKGPRDVAPFPTTGGTREASRSRRGVGLPERCHAPSCRLGCPEGAEKFFKIFYFNVFGNTHNCSHLKGPEGTPAISTALLTKLLVARKLRRLTWEEYPQILTFALIP